MSIRTPILPAGGASACPASPADRVPSASGRAEPVATLL